MSVIASVSDARHEVVDGREVEVSPPPPAHGRAQLRIGVQLFAALGTDPTLEVFTDLHVHLAPGLVRRPDAAVARRERLDDAVEAQPTGAVLLMVEVLSPSTALIDLRDKTTEHAAAGIPGYLVVDPRGHHCSRTPWSKGATS